MGQIGADEASQLLPLLALAAHPAWREAWLDTANLSWSSDALTPLQAMLLATSEQPKREAALDAELDKKRHTSRIASALVHAQIPWEHASFKKLLSQPETRQLGCALFAMADPERLEAWAFDGEPRSEEELLDVLRALLFFDEEPQSELFDDTLSALREEEEGGPRLLARVEAMLAALDPGFYARGALDGSYELSWNEDAVAVADFLALNHETSWLETLAILELSRAKNAFGFAALLAMSAAADLHAVSLDEDEEQAQRHATLFDTLRAGEPWEALATELKLHFGFGVADEELAPLLAEVALHERLFDADLPSLGVSGLPLSATLPEAIDAQAASELFTRLRDETKPDEETTCTAVRTLCDLRRIAADQLPELMAATTPLFQDADLLIAPLIEHAQPAIALAARRTLSQMQPIPDALAPSPQDAEQAMIAGLDVPGSPELLAQLVITHEGTLGMWAAQELTELPLDESLALLGPALAECPPYRAPYLRALLESLVQEDHFVG